MLNFLGAGLFEAMWNNFYNSIVRNVSPVTKGGIILVLCILVLIFIITAFKSGDEKKPIKNWFSFWCAIFILILAIVYTILCSL